jgi:hypothetical protein
VGHRATYLTILSAELSGRLLALLEEGDVHADLEVVSARAEIASGIPYVHFDVAPSTAFEAHCGGIPVDLRPLLGADAALDFYLPVLGVTPNASPTALAHELLHLRDLLDLVERDPGYPERAFRLALNTLTDSSLLDESIDLAICKAFAFEPQAYRLEYSLGETWIDVPSQHGEPLRIQCQSEDGLVGIRMADYVKQVEAAYLAKFPHGEAEIRASIVRATDRHGAALFGPTASRVVREIQRATALRLLVELARSRRAG